MSSTISQPIPAERAFSTAFISLDASLTGIAALVKVVHERATGGSHVIVRRREGEAIYFYLFELEPTLSRLSGYSRQTLAETTLVSLLDLHEFMQSPTLEEHDAPLMGAVVVRNTEAIGFVPTEGPEFSDSLWRGGASGEVVGPQDDTSISQNSSLDELLGGTSRSRRYEAADEEPRFSRIDRSEPRREPGPAKDTTGINSPGVTRSGRIRTTPRRSHPPKGNEANLEVGSNDEFNVDASGFIVRSGTPQESIVEIGTLGTQREELPPSTGPAVAPPRFFNARTPDRVAEKAQTYVIVQVAGEPVPTIAGTATAAAPIGNFIGELTIDVHAPGLKAIGPSTLTLLVPSIGDSAALRFGFTANRPGIHQIDVMAWNGSAQVAGVSLQIAVDIEVVTAGANEVVGDLDMREPEDGEYTLDVAMEQETRRYRFQLRSDKKDVWPPMYSEPLLNDRQKTYEATLANLNAQARNLYGLQPKDQARWLRGLGSLLFEQLVPDKLKALLIERRGEIRVLNILSEADPTPWELLFLADPESGKGDFLADSTTVARWRYGAGPSRSLKKTNKFLVLPDDAPPQAQTELQSLQTVLRGASTIGDLTNLNDLVEMGGFDLLHFAAHNVNVPQSLGGAYVPFGHQRWDITFLGSVPPNKYKSRNPLVFMNACTTSGTSAMYTELSSWADRFLKCGSGAFIGTLWEVRDSSARMFSEAFYAELMQGETLGRAMQVARTKMRNANPGDPTPLAYTLYGNPLARLEQS